MCQIIHLYNLQNIRELVPWNVFTTVCML
jgi:hypothetical protein